MARIKTYNNDPIIQSGDKVIGTDATDNSTKNFGIDQLLAYFRDNITGGDQADNITGFTATTSGNTVTLRLNFTTGIPLVASFILAEGTGSIHSGTQDPITGQVQGRVGDFYLQVVPASADGSTPPVSNLYGPLASATGTTSFANWGTPTSLLGQQGIQGIAGTQGNSITIENIDLGSAGQESSFDLQIVDASGADVGSPQTITLQPGSDGATITSIGSTNSGVGTDSIVTVTTDAATNNIFTFTIPAGATGVQGIQGFQGDGVEVTSTTTGANLGDSSTVTFTNTDVDPATGATTQTTETLTVRAGVQGHQGRFDLEVYQVLASTLPRPATPEGGSYDTVLGTFNSTGLTAGWVTVIPSIDETTQRLWESRLNLNPISYVSGTALGASWSTPFLAGSTGPTGVAAGFGTPTATTLAPVDATTLATATVTSSGPDTAKVFALGVPAGLKGDKGDNGTNGSTITVTQARNTDDDANIVTFTSSDTTVTPVVVTIPDGEDVTTNMIQATAITEYSAADTYNTNHAVYDSTGIYASIIDGNINNPLTDVGSWTKITAFVTDAQISKLDGIETAATADQTDAEIRVAVGAADDSNVFTDAEKTKLSNVEALATADQTGAEIKTAYEGEANTNAYTDAEKAKLTGIETGATEDQTAAEIRALVEAADDSNVFTDADHTKLDATTSLTTVEEFTGIRPLDAETVTFDTATTFTYDAANSDFKNNPTLHQLITVAATSISANPIAVVSIDADNLVTLASAPAGVVIGTPVALVFQRTVGVTQLEIEAAITEVTGEFNLLSRVFHAGNIPTTDPGVSGHWWNDRGTFVLSGFTAASGGGVTQVTTLDTNVATEDEAVILTAVDGSNVPGIYRRASGVTTWTLVQGGDSFDNIDEVEHFREFSTTVTFNAGGSQTVLIIPVDVPSDFLINAGSYELVSIGSTTLSPPIDVVMEAILANGTFRDVTLAGIVPSGVLSVGENRAVFRRDVAHPSDSQVNITSTRLLVTGEIDVTGLPDEDPDREDATYINNGYIAVSGQTTQSISDWSGLSSYEVDNEVNFRNDIYKRRGSDIPSTTGVSIVPGFSTLVSFKGNTGITGDQGYADTFSFADPNIAAPSLVNGRVYRFTIGSGSTQYIIDADPGSIDVTPNVGSLYGNGLQSPDTLGRIWQLRLLTPLGAIAPGYTIVGVGGTEYNAAQQPAAVTALLALLAGKPDGTAIDDLDEGDQISFGGSPNTAPSEDISWELISNATLAASRYDLFEGQLLSFHKIPADETEPSLNQGDLQRTLFEGRVTGLSTIAFSALGDRTITNGTQSVLLPNGMADEIEEGDYVTGRGSSFPGIFVGVAVETLGTDSTNHARFRILSLRQDNSEAVVGEDGTNVIPGLGNITRPGDIIQIARLENVLEVEDTTQLPAGLPVRFQSRVATSGRLLPFMAAVTTANPDVFNEYESRLTYDFAGTIVQTDDFDRLTVTVVGTENQIGSVQGEIHSDLMGYVIHENGDTYFLANPTVIEDAMGDPTDVYNFDVVSVGGGSFAEVFRDVTSKVEWVGEHTIYLATEVVPYLNVTRTQEARWDEAAARNIPEIIRTHSTIGLTDLDDASSADDEFSFVPTTTGDSGISISANNRSFTPNVVLRIADTHSILSMPVSATDIAKLRVGDSYFFSAGGTRLVGHIITDAEANTDNGFGRYQAAATDGVVHLYLDDVSSRVVANIGTLGVNRFSINRHNQNIETEYGWFFQVTTFNGITYTTTDVSAFRFYAIDTTDQIILKDGSVEVAIRHLDGTLIAGVGVQEEGTDLTTLADTLNFVGAGVIATGTGSTKTITINSATTIPEHNTIPVTSSGTSNPNDLIGWELEIGRPGEGLQRDFVAANGTSTSRINLMLIDAHPRLRVTFSDGTVALATIIGSSSSTVTTTQLIGQFDVARESSAINTPETVDIRYFGEDVPSSYIASPLSVNANDEVIYNGEEITTTNMRTSGLLFRGIGNPENWFGGSGASRASQVIAGDQYQNSSTGHTFERSATGLVTATNGWSSASTIIANTSASLNGLTITPDSQSSPTVLTIASPANSDLAINASPSPGSTGSGNERVTIEGVQFNDGAIASVTSINGDPVANADALFRSGGYINAWITGTVNAGTASFGLGFASTPVEVYTDIQGDSRDWLSIPTLTITGTGASAAFALGDGIWTRLTNNVDARTILEHESTFLL